jgi:hypothetical protein
MKCAHVTPWSLCVPPVLRHIANLWTLMQYPTAANEWSLDRKLAAIRDAGFDGVCWAPSAELFAGAQRYNLSFVGGMASSRASEFPAILQDLKRWGAHHVNVQLGTDDMLTAETLPLALDLLAQAESLGLRLAIESHRDTCTETPEKTYALADAFQQATNRLLPISWDFSHFAVVKHLVPGNFSSRLLTRPDLIQAAQQFHFRPFNGHHVQVPITTPHGEITQEVHEWLPFAEDLLRCWLRANLNTDREICPELGPVESGYALSTFPDRWKDAAVLREQIDSLWHRVIAQVSKPETL